MSGYAPLQTGISFLCSEDLTSDHVISRRLLHFTRQQNFPRSIWEIRVNHEVTLANSQATGSTAISRSSDTEQTVARVG